VVMTDLEKWKAFLNEQGVGFNILSYNGVTPRIWFVGAKVENYFAAVQVYFNDDGSLNEIRVSENHA